MNAKTARHNLLTNRQHQEAMQSEARLAQEGEN
jgi:hypothetical protein